MSDTVEIVHGPIAATRNQQIIYSVTLNNGFVVTSPEGFGRDNGQQFLTPEEAEILARTPRPVAAEAFLP